MCDAVIIYQYSLLINEVFTEKTLVITRGPGGSMSQVVGLLNNSYKPITNTAWLRAQLCKLQKRCTRLAVASDKVYQLLAHGRWFSPASSTTKTDRHDIAEILLKVALSTKSMQNIVKQVLTFFLHFVKNVHYHLSVMGVTLIATNVKSVIMTMS